MLFSPVRIGAIDSRRVVLAPLTGCVPDAPNLLLPIDLMAKYYYRTACLTGQEAVITGGHFIAPTESSGCLTGHLCTDGQMAGWRKVD